MWWMQNLGKYWELSKQSAQNFDRERFNLRKLNELDIRKEYQIEFTNRFRALENLGDGEHINRAWENIKENIKYSVNKVEVCTN